MIQLIQTTNQLLFFQQKPKMSNQRNMVKNNRVQYTTIDP